RKVCALPLQRGQAVPLGRSGTPPSREVPRAAGGLPGLAGWKSTTGRCACSSLPAMRPKPACLAALRTSVLVGVGGGVATARAAAATRTAVSTQPPRKREGRRFTVADDVCLNVGSRKL